MLMSLIRGIAYGAGVMLVIAVVLVLLGNWLFV